jgi:hypothetical protein
MDVIDPERREVQDDHDGQRAIGEDADDARGEEEPAVAAQDGERPQVQPPPSYRCFATNAAAWARRSRLSFERIELT